MGWSTLEASWTAWHSTPKAVANDSNRKQAIKISLKGVAN